MKIRMTLWLLMAPLLLCAQADSKAGFTITGQLTGLPDHSGVSLNDINNPTDTVAVTSVANGTFVLKGKIAEPNLYQLNLDGAQKKLLLFIGNENISLKGNTNAINEVQVSGSPVHKDFEDFRKEFDPLFQGLNQLNQQLRSQPNLQPTDSLVLVYRNYTEKISDKIDQFITARKSSPVSAFLLVVTSGLYPDYHEAEKRFDMLDPGLREGFYGKILAEQLAAAKLNAVGTEALDFTQADTSGNPVSLSSFRGKYVLIDFWASWCRPCRMENPNVVQAYQKFKSKNFTVLGVSLDRNREAWLQAIKDDQLAWTQVSDLQYWNNAVARQYKIEQIPQNYLVDPDGKVIGKNLRGQALESKLCELLGCE